jgi:hypothetical protein
VSLFVWSYISLLCFLSVYCLCRLVVVLSIFCFCPCPCLCLIFVLLFIFVLSCLSLCCLALPWSYICRVFVHRIWRQNQGSWRLLHGLCIFTFAFAFVVAFCLCICVVLLSCLIFVLSPCPHSVLSYFGLVLFFSVPLYVV